MNIHDKTVLVEFYPNEPREMLMSNLQHEVISNYEQGMLGASCHPFKRYIWSPDRNYAECIKNYQFRYYPDDHREIVNLFYQNNEITRMSGMSKLYVVAQESESESGIADLESDHFIEILQDDFEITDIDEIEFIVCNLGRKDRFLSEFRRAFRKTQIIAYKCLVSLDIANNKIIGFDDSFTYIKNLDLYKVALLNINEHLQNLPIHSFLPISDWRI